MFFVTAGSKLISPLAGQRARPIPINVQLPRSHVNSASNRHAAAAGSSERTAIATEQDYVDGL
ncbi:MAG: hypothetical protein E7I69_06855, partial [Corynebacterium sp.]|nr:hypothetical protein [Corynebacterium sp.]